MTIAMNKYFLILSVVFVSYLKAVSSESNLEDDNETQGRYLIEGKVFPMELPFTPPNWQANTRLHVNGGEYIGFVKEDGTFIIHNMPSGSYILEVLHPEFSYEPVRVEINSKGKFRARKVNHIQTSVVVQVPYPLKLKPLGKTRYFQVREQWRITDFLFNPMILMMFLPLLLIMILPKMLSDPETKREMEQIGSLTNFEMPAVSDYVTNYLATAQSQPVKKNAKNKKRQ
ncbi:hypothetical protein PPYR_00875 [Photinus pyralis]|uniref:ER membrane protein complex subunit 7 beta-sandwich domain-containing protein n=2 Tax=Photinus pyralis TaxID=7054 RepID=A0A5N4B2V5_PHOPY|nr:ER membrane protein complex subunit 7 [Photinus pyralis]KAB0803905.1 hypothetical protein PPYR_00875 [Photinus pyralis]